jgi:hypothetical protein
LQSQAMGWGYLERVGIPSLMSAKLNDHNHDFQIFEQDANRRAFNYFNENVDGFYQTEGQYENNLRGGVRKGWNFDRNPLDVNHVAERNIYYDYRISEHRDLVNSLSLSARFGDNLCWLAPVSSIHTGIYNGMYYLSHRVTP